MATSRTLRLIIRHVCIVLMVFMDIMELLGWETHGTSLYISGEKDKTGTDPAAK